MSDKAKVYNILIPEKYVDGNGEEKTFFHRVGTGFPNKAGGMNCVVPPGIALSGEFTILPRKTRAEDDGTQGADGGDEIPY